MKFRSIFRPGACVNVLRRNLMPNEFDRLIAEAARLRLREPFEHGYRVFKVIEQPQAHDQPEAAREAGRHPDR